MDYEANQEYLRKLLDEITSSDESFHPSSYEESSEDEKLQPKTKWRNKTNKKVSKRSLFQNEKKVKPNDTAKEVETKKLKHTVHMENKFVSQTKKSDHTAILEEKEDSQTTICEENMEGNCENKTALKSIPDNDVDTPKKRSRKKVSNKKKWACNIRKSKHQAGEAYITRKGKEVPAKMMKTFKDCMNACKFKCSLKITLEERNEIFQSYYTLTSNEKHYFIINTTECFSVGRAKKTHDGSNSRRVNTFRYYFIVKNEKMQVCKQFYLGTLSVSQKPIYNVHKNKDGNTNTPKPDLRGKATNSLRNLPAIDKEHVRQHINSFHCVESHYCRAKTTRKYLESGLNVAKMYDFYVTHCKEINIVPLKQSMYRRIFVSEFNLGFHVPKSDRCDLCESYKISVKENLISNEEKTKYEKHIEEKKAMRAERKADKEKDIPVLSFDLQNVITCPRAEISSFFYRRKLNVYNLTAYYSVTKTVYCEIWPETTSGRAGNDLASAFKKILDCVADDNDITELITWSDSCVPQNRNSIISNAILDFLRSNPQVKSITMKYSVPGHSCIQEVDNVHSVIEKALSENEFYSPLGLVQILKRVNRKHPYRIIQMQKKHFLDFAFTSKLFNYAVIPFTKLASIKFTQSLFEMHFKKSHYQEDDFQKANIKLLNKQMRKSRLFHKTPSHSALNILPKVVKTLPEMSEAKKNDIQKMFHFMPVLDRNYYLEIFDKK